MAFLYCFPLILRTKSVSGRFSISSPTFPRSVFQRRALPFRCSTFVQYFLISAYSGLSKVVISVNPRVLTCSPCFCFHFQKNFHKGGSIFLKDILLCKTFCVKVSLSLKKTDINIATSAFSAFSSTYMIYPILCFYFNISIAFSFKYVSCKQNVI